MRNLLELIVLAVFIPVTSGITHYVLWGGSQPIEPIFVAVGDIIQFTWSGPHNIVQFPTLSCDDNGAVPIYSGTAQIGTFGLIIEEDDANSQLFFASDVGYVVISPENQKFHL